MGLFGNKDKDIQNAEYEEISEVSEPTAASSEADITETVTTPETTITSSEDTASSYNYGTDESVTFTPDPAPATQTPAEPADVIPEAVVEPVSEPVSTVEDTFSLEEERVPVGKYNLENPKDEVTTDSKGAPVINTNPNYLAEQAAEIKKELVTLIDSVTEASENLLERLHEDDIMDITTDIKKLQTTLANKGLLDSDFDIK